MNVKSELLDKLSPKQREVLLLKLSQANKEKSKKTAISKSSEVGEPLPLSFAQQRLWVLDEFENESAAYNIPFAFTLRGHFDFDVFNKSLKEIIQRQAILRTIFQTVEETPVQIIREKLDVPISFFDLSDQDISDKAEKIREITDAESGKPFDIHSQESLWRVCVIKLLIKQLLNLRPSAAAYFHLLFFHENHK